MEDNENEIRQGFICPLCKNDYGDSDSLAKHFQLSHANDKSIDNDAILLVKDAFGKAKQKILNIDFLLNQPGSSGIYDDSRMKYYEEEQTIGIKRNLKYLFIEEREKHVNSVVVDTNNLIMRLDKLINDIPADVSRKDFEKDTVPWESDSVSTCQTCTVKFNITRRRHHCRLCGSILCHNCSLFLPICLAKRLVDPAFSDSSLNVFDSTNNERRFSLTDNDSVHVMKSKTGKFFSSFGIDVKFGNQSDNNDHSLRVCRKCRKLLEKRREAMDQLQTPSIFKDMYDKLCQLLKEASNLAPSYRRTVASLKNGESLYSLEAAINMRKKLVALQHEIQSLMERIEKWGMNDDPMAQRPTPREFVLRANIRFNCSVSLRETFKYFEDPPSPEEYKRLQIKFREKFQRNESNSTNSLSGVDSNSTNKHGMKTSASFSGFKADDGWTPEPTKGIINNSTISNEELHPLQQQYLISKNYLEQAAKSGRLDEIEMLEKNVIDIREELGRLNLTIP